MENSSQRKREQLKEELKPKKSKLGLEGRHREFIATETPSLKKRNALLTLFRETREHSIKSRHIKRVSAQKMSQLSPRLFTILP